MRSIFVVPSAVAAVALLVASVVLYRGKFLSVRYFVGWVVVGASLGVGSLVLALVHGRVSSEVLTVGLVSLGLITLLGLLVQLSISVSGLQRQLRQVAQAVALLGANQAEDPDRSDGQNHEASSAVGLAQDT
jgi:Uncharacterized conserved protein (DUF2304)